MQVEAAEEDVVAGRAGCEMRLARANRAMAELEEEMVGRTQQHQQHMYDDEYDDSYDEFGTLNLGERTAETEER